jgi:hypothetical protein
MKAATTLTPVLGDWVQAENYGYIGRVTEIHHWCPEGPAWIQGQSIPVTEEQVNGRWVSILIQGGGAAVQPISTVRVLDETEVPATALDNLWAEVYFRD